MTQALTKQQLIARHPDAAPDQLFDLACLYARTSYSWATVGLVAQSAWLDTLANAPTSFATH